MFKIYFDPGHGGSDSGAVANGLKEKDIALAICLKMREIIALEYQDVAVKMSRVNDSFPTLKQRTDAANSWGADFYLSVHINSGGGTGFESFTYPGTTQSIQNVIHNEILNVISLPNRGQKQQDFHVLRESAMPALLTENGFIDSANDSTKMKDSTWIQNVARAHVTGLEKAFNLKRKVTTASEPKPVKTASSEALAKMKTKGIIQGYADGSLHENEPLTLARLSIILDKLGLLG